MSAVRMLAERGGNDGYERLLCTLTDRIILARQATPQSVGDAGECGENAMGEFMVHPPARGIAAELVQMTSAFCDGNVAD